MKQLSWVAFSLFALILFALPAVAAPAPAEAEAAVPTVTDDAVTWAENDDCAASLFDIELAASGLTPEPTPSSTGCSPCSQDPCKNKPYGNFCTISWVHGLYGTCEETFAETCGGVPFASYCQCWENGPP